MFDGKTSTTYTLCSILICRTCPVCQRTFQTERGLKQHVKAEGTASQCRRHQEIATKAQIIRTNRERRAEAKKGYFYDAQTINHTVTQI